MRQLARTLLILGGVTACERAHPLVDDRERPAVGNIGQTGRPYNIIQGQREAAKPGASVPLFDNSGAPVVGNIGQAGAPAETKPPPRRVERARRAARATTAAEGIDRPALPASVPPRAPRSSTRHAIEIAPQPQVALQPLVNASERPMVGNIPQREGRMVGKSAPDHEIMATLSPGERARFAFHRGQSVTGPLFDGREQPMVGNMGRRGPSTPEEKLASAASRIARLDRALQEATTDERRADLRANLGKLLDEYVVLERRVAAGER